MSNEEMQDAPFDASRTGSEEDMLEYEDTGINCDGCRRKRPFTSTEKSLIFFGIICLVVIVALAVALGKKKEEKKTILCESSGCLKAASSIIEAMDTTVDPCDDFHQYACGGWLRETPIPPGYPIWDRFQELSHKNLYMLKNYIETHTMYGKAQNNVRKFYHSCMDESKISRDETLADFTSLLSNISSDTGEFQLLKTLVKAHRLAIWPMFQILVGPDERNPENNIIKIEAGETPFPFGLFKDEVSREENSLHLRVPATISSTQTPPKSTTKQTSPRLVMANNSIVNDSEYNVVNDSNAKEKEESRSALTTTEVPHIKDTHPHPVENVSDLVEKYLEETKILLIALWKMKPADADREAQQILHLEKRLTIRADMRYLPAAKEFILKTIATERLEISSKKMDGSVRQSLADRSLELDGLIERNAEALRDRTNEMDTFEFVESMKNPNTVKKTAYDMKKLRQWLLETGEGRDPEDIPPQELNLYIARMFLNVRKGNGDEFEPGTLSSMYSSFHRYLTSKDYPKNIISSQEFKHARDVLSSKKKSLKQQGLGNKKLRADSFTHDEVQILKDKKLLGKDNPQSLINTMWLYNTIHFGLRGRQEHTDMLWGDFERGATATGRKYIMFTERATKTRNGVASDTRQFMPKMFEQPGDPFCPVEMFTFYESKRPDDMKTPNSRFYLGLNQRYMKGGSGSSSWYLPKPMGKNTIGNLAKLMSESAGFSSRHVNHSGRKTCISRLLDANCPPNEVVQISGHKNVMSLNSYNTVSIEKQVRMSEILHGPSTSVHAPVNNADNDFNTDDLSDQDLIIASQEIESTLTRINNYENPGQVIDLSITQNQDGSLSLSKPPAVKPESLFHNCTFNHQAHDINFHIHNRTQAYNAMKIKDLQQKCSMINWQEYLNNLMGLQSTGPQQHDELIVLHETALRKVCSIVNEYNKNAALKPILRRYILLNVVRSLKPYFDMNTFQTDIDPDEEIEIEGEHWRRCTFYANKAFGYATGSIYVNATGAVESFKQVQNLVEHVKKAFKEYLLRKIWLDPTTKNHATAKIDEMIEKVSYPSFIMNTTFLDGYYEHFVVETDWFRNLLNWRKFVIKNMVNTLSQKFDRQKSWINPPVTVESDYSPVRNDIIFPIALFHLPIFNPEGPSALNFGAIGSLIGHEITHAFDIQGRQYDGYGRLRDWWDPVTADMFNTTTRCMKDQYDHFIIGNMSINGEQTLEENIADNGGLRAAHIAYELWMDEYGQEAPLPGVNLNNQQIFYISFAQLYCSKWKDSGIKDFLRRDSHSPGPYRIEGALSNSLAFQDVFQCSYVSKYNPATKCQVW